MTKKVFALGFFDSIHIGHRYLLDFAKKQADKRKETVVVATFDDNFLTALGRNDAEIFLLNERQRILSFLGFDDTLVLPSCKEFLSAGRTEFLDFIINKNPSAIVVGKDYRFGRNAEGDALFLQEYCQNKGIDVYVVDLLNYNGKKVSSTEIRDLLKEGEVKKASELLGDRFFYSGRVKQGRKQGRTIGFPTVNIDIPPDKIQIMSGVYATKTIVNGIEYVSVTNVGKHPTFGDDVFNVETYVIDENVNLYGEDIKIEFYEFLRNVVKFENKSELAEQIEKDVERTKKVLL